MFAEKERERAGQGCEGVSCGDIVDHGGEMGRGQMRNESKRYMRRMTVLGVGGIFILWVT